MQFDRLDSQPSAWIGGTTCESDDPSLQSFSGTGCMQVGVAQPACLGLNSSSRAILYPSNDCSGGIGLRTLGGMSFSSAKYNDGSTVNQNIKSILLQGGIVHDEDVASDNFDGLVNSFWPLPALPAGTSVTAYHQSPQGTHYFAVETGVTLPNGLPAYPQEILIWNPQGGFGQVLTRAEAAVSINDPDAKFDAFTFVDSTAVFSMDISIRKSGITVADEDLFTLGGILVFDGSAAGIDPALDLDAAHYDNRSEHFFLSFDGSGTVGGIAFSDEDLIEWDSTNSSWVLNPSTATGVAYDGSERDADWRAADLDAVWLQMETEMAPCTPDNLLACAEELRRIRDGLSQFPLP